MSKHSPGPWRTSWGQTRAADGSVVADFGHRKAEMEHGKDEMLKADTRLIAAAPELAALAEAIRDSMACVAPRDDGGDWEVSDTDFADHIDVSGCLHCMALGALGAAEGP